MGLIINTNISALNTYNQLNKNNNALNSSLEKLSSGYKINNASDDAAGLAISEKMKGQIRGLDQANENSQNAVSMVQTADGALDETESILQRMRELAVQSASDTNTDSDRENIQDEIDSLVDEINNIANTTEFNTKKLLNGSMGAEVSTAAATVETNTALAVASGTLADTTALSALTDTAGNTLGIASGDTITVSYMQEGTLYQDTIDVTSTTDLAALFAGTNASSDITFAVASGSATATASTAGTAGAIYGLTITVTDGTTKTTNTDATNALSSFTQTTKAQDLQEDGTALIQIGANTGQSIAISFDNMDAASLGVQGLTVDTQESANVAISVIDTATATVSAQRAMLGAVENRLDSTINNLSTSSENLNAAESTIRDTDMASEMATYTKLSVLTQAATSMLAQANSQPEMVLKLLQ